MTQPYSSRVLDWLETRNPGQPEFLQAAREIVGDVAELVDAQPRYRDRRVLERLLEPDRVITVRVTWEDDAGRPRINRGWRVQTCNALGPYKGGLRFEPGVSESVFKFLGLEQTLKNSLTGLPIGGAKGGADFDPSVHSDDEVRRFCQALMTELVHHIGPEKDVPAGDIGVGDREIGYLFGQYTRLTRSFDGGLTGKPPDAGGSALRSEATGYGLVHFTQAALEGAGEDLAGSRCLVSGAGNVALHCAEKLLEAQCKVLTLSDSGGTLHFPDGLAQDDIDWLRGGDGRLADLATERDLRYHEETRPWSLEADLAFPCATQNELGHEDARALARNGCRWVAEGANMPCSRAAIEVLREAGVRLCPGKAANAGGVVVSALEMSQNACFRRWDRAHVHDLLRSAMCGIHDRCRRLMDGRNDVDYVRAANRAGFVRVADAVIAQGL